MRAGAIAAGARENWALIAVLAVAALVRVAAATTYGPALMWSDSWQYLYATDLPGGFAPDRPNGYPLFLLAMGTGRHLAAVTAVPARPGPGRGRAAVALLRRLGCPRGSATLASAVVLLDAYAIALEQHVLAEALFTFVLVDWAFVAVAMPRTAPLAAAAGALLVAAVAVRAVAIFVVPAWIAFALWGYRDRWARMAALGVLIAGLLTYATWHDVSAGGRGLDQLRRLGALRSRGRDRRVRGTQGARRGPCVCPPASDRPDGWPNLFLLAVLPGCAGQREFSDLYRTRGSPATGGECRLRAFATR